MSVGRRMNPQCGDSDTSDAPPRRSALIGKVPRSSAGFIQDDALPGAAVE
jgi:hypothetical protein